MRIEFFHNDFPRCGSFFHRQAVVFHSLDILVFRFSSDAIRVKSIVADLTGETAISFQFD
jgi:hypothetical protein